MSAKHQASLAQPAGAAPGSAGLSAFAVDWLPENQQRLNGVGANSFALGD